MSGDEEDCKLISIEPPDPEEDIYRKGAPSYILIASDGIALYVIDSVGPACQLAYDDTVGFLENDPYDQAPEPGVYLIQPDFTGPDYYGEYDTLLEPVPLTQEQRTAYLERGAPWDPYEDEHGVSWYNPRPNQQSTDDSKT